MDKYGKGKKKAEGQILDKQLQDAFSIFQIF